ncbi:histidine kinase [Actinoplanes sp. TRM 88003]|uniref:histidine kinase n=1 Tax=Paractinoplanes aksuensis TaxID=2939490 RepID=A0ABT1DS63_9ACTN|nr:ATP-binding protein [Actinoplanes aksuensis]MCO8273667.1 histidine kinase [Actinoplanes aksuensis]
MLRAVLRVTFAVLVLAPVFGVVTGLAARAGAGPGAAWWGAAGLGAITVPAVRLSGSLADWVVYRGRADPALAVVRLGAALDAQPDAAAVPATVLQVIVDATYLDSAELRGGAHLSAVVGRPGPDAVVFPVVYQGEELATLSVAPRRGESDLTARDRTVITQLAVHAAPALHGARARADLTEAHARLVHSREEERRRLRRDLHDDLSPSLAGLALSAAAVARRAAGVDEGLVRLADDLYRDIKAAVSQTREIAYGLRPPILDDRGLVAAIRHRTAGVQADRLEVSVRAPEHRLVLPAAVDLAALRIVQEAVTNVRRHAGARACVISLALAADHLEVIVGDDGQGFPERLAPGLGLASIRERAAELGGTVRFGRAPQGGGEVAVRLPLPPGAPA